jgi:hypothetical protein
MPGIGVPPSAAPTDPAIALMLGSDPIVHHLRRHTRHTTHATHGTGLLRHHGARLHQLRQRGL